MICPICRHAEDDHNEVGTCNKCCMHGGACSGFDSLAPDLAAPEAEWTQWSPLVWR